MKITGIFRQIKNTSKTLASPPNPLSNCKRIIRISSDSERITFSGVFVNGSKELFGSSAKNHLQLLSAFGHHPFGPTPGTGQSAFSCPNRQPAAETLETGGKGPPETEYPRRDSPSSSSAEKCRGAGQKPRRMASTVLMQAATP